MTLGTELLSYTGNSGLGAGSGAPVVGAGDNNVINQTNRDLMLINHENNVRQYEQKIKDRDAELKLLAEGKVKTGEVLPQDRKLLDDMQKQNDKNYFDLISINDKNSPAYKQAYSKYQTGLRQTEDAATHAQYRYVGRKKLEKEQSDKTLDEDKQSYQNHLSNQDKLDFWKGDYAPYQKSLDFDADDLHQRIISGTLGNPTQTTNKKTVTSRNGVETVYNTETTSDVPQVVKRTKGAVASQQLPLKAESTTFTKTDDNGRVYKVTEDQVDFDALKNNAAAVYNYGGKDAQQMMMLRDKLETMPDELYVPYMQHIMKRVNDYNEELGLKPGDDNYIDPKPLAARLGIDPVTGKRSGFRIMMTTPDFAALETLAQYNGNYKQSSEAYDKDASEFGLKKGESDARIRAANALANERNAKAALSNKKGKVLDNQFNPIQTFDELFKGKTFLERTSSNQPVLRVNRQDMSKAFLDNLGIDPLNEHGDFNIVPANVKYKGKSIPTDDVMNMYQQWMNTDDAKKLQNKIGKEPDVFDFMFSIDPDVKFEPEIVGKVKPIYKQDKNGKMVVINPNEAGKITRSNKLTSWINQRKQMGVKGDKLLMEESSSEDNNSEE